MRSVEDAVSTVKPAATTRRHVAKAQRHGLFGSPVEDQAWSRDG